MFELKSKQQKLDSVYLESCESAHIYELTSFEFQSVSQLTHLSL